jgi:hypothetical protein
MEAAAEETCGQELARDAEVPDRLGRLMAYVADNMETHAAWVGAGVPEAKREHDALLEIAEAYRAIGKAAARAARAMRDMKDFPAAPHDPDKLDRDGFRAWMREKIRMQRELADLLHDHADASEDVLRKLDAH